MQYLFGNVAEFGKLCPVTKIVQGTEGVSLAALAAADVVLNLAVGGVSVWRVIEPEQAAAVRAEV